MEPFALAAPINTAFGKHLLKEFEEHLRDDNLLRNVMLWLGAGMDAGDGRLRLKRRWFMPWKQVLDLIWKADQSEGVIAALAERIAANVT